MSRWDILGMGVVAVDDLLTVERYPPPDVKQPILDEQRQGGGLIATALVAAARLGARTAYLGVLGDDDLSLFALEGLESAGVDCSLVIRRTGARPVHATIIVDASNGQRTILHTHRGVVYPSPDQIPTELIAQCRVLLLDPFPGAATIQAERRAHALGTPVVADIEAPALPAAQHLIAHADHLIVGLEVGRRVTGLDAPAEMVVALARPDRPCCAVTAGAEGCWYSVYGGGAVHVPALPVQAADTTGCGDVFHGAYAASVARGEPVDAAVHVATVAAGLKATLVGGRAGIPDRAAVDRAMYAWRSGCMAQRRAMQ
jgi:sugar/nucleoside kinase (ribokinase family)